MQILKNKVQIRVNMFTVGFRHMINRRSADPTWCATVHILKYTSMHGVYVRCGGCHAAARGHGFTHEQE